MNLKRFVFLYVLDLVCWAGATVILFGAGHNVSAAIVGATGTVLMYRNTERLMRLYDLHCLVKRIQKEESRRN